MGRRTDVQKGSRLMNPHAITEQFERRLCHYTNAPYAVAVDNCSNALFLALTYCNVKARFITVPKHTYPAVPCEVIHAGGIVKFVGNGDDGIVDDDLLPGHCCGSYQLWPSPVWDCALHFTADMYKPGQFMCLSFTGPHKHLKLGKGGAILTDNFSAYNWLKRARFSGRRECSYLDDSFDMLGWNFYMMPEIAARGLQLMDQFYTPEGKKHNEPISLRYPDLSKFPIYGG